MREDRHIAWPTFCIVLFSTMTVLATDYAWRMMQAPIANIASIGLIVLMAGNLAIFTLSRRTR